MTDDIVIEKDKEISTNDGELQEFREDLSLFMEAGFLAVKLLDEVGAVALFKAAQVVAPESTAPRIGLGYIALNKLELKEASKIFKKILDEEPENYLAQAFLGIAFALQNSERAKGEELIKEILTKTDDSDVKNLCEVSLTWIEKDMKKKDGLFAAAASKSSKESSKEPSKTASE